MISPEVKRISISVAALLLASQPAWSALTELSDSAVESSTDEGDLQMLEGRSELIKMLATETLKSAPSQADRKPAVLDENGQQLTNFGGLEKNDPVNLADSAED